MDGLTQPSDANRCHRRFNEMTDTDSQLQSDPDQVGFDWLVNTNRNQVMSFRPDPSPENACWLLIRTDPMNLHVRLHQLDIDAHRSTTPSKPEHFRGCCYWICIQWLQFQRNPVMRSVEAGRQSIGCPSGTGSVVSFSSVQPAQTITSPTVHGGWQLLSYCVEEHPMATPLRQWAITPPAM